MTGEIPVDGGMYGEIRSKPEEVTVPRHTSSIFSPRMNADQSNLTQIRVHPRQMLCGFQMTGDRCTEFAQILHDNFMSPPSPLHIRMTW
jgi:hypothetical protein